MGAGGEGKATSAAAVRVLVVDDFTVDRKVVELLLWNHKGGAAPFHATTVDSGKKAMELLGQGRLESSATDANATDYQSFMMLIYATLKRNKFK